MTWDDLLPIALSFPDVTESTSYGTPALKLGTKFLLREREPGLLALQRPSIDERDMLLDAEPELFFITDHYRHYPYVLVRLADLDAGRFRGLFETLWRSKANARQLSAYKSA
ncbi:MmcQ/YjbR family DNA-binding protein [Pelagibacterium lacus]|uniref:MmcQ/YjbR family DNA-binding protein n=1 Tax=Pelagibacterium lacus TaxID=2282655 RepID=A0A369W0Q7_9HYPH|nr:MmcQ/YjbR family DNA-binding protein [Pelagibacterium lacus]RDE08254.1 MmcQ/YjbR family DNA-binding protein [Pelagibacterium lacus]